MTWTAYDPYRRIVDARPAGGRRVHVTFGDGEQRVVDLGGVLRGPMFEEILADDSVFAGFAFDRVGGAIEWPNGADIAPEWWDHLPAAAEESA